MDKETATEREQEAIKGPLEELGETETAAMEEPDQAPLPTKRGKRNGHQPQPALPQAVEEDDLALEEQSLPEDQEEPYGAAPGDSLDQIRMAAPCGPTSRRKDSLVGMANPRVSLILWMTSL